MSLTSGFWSEMNKPQEKKKKKQTTTTTTSKSSGKRETKKSSNDMTSSFWGELEDDDIAPVSERIKSRMTASDIAPVSDKKDGILDGWFKKSDSDSIAKTILGTGTDILSDLGTGLIGIGEKAVDALASIAPYAENAQFYQNGMFDLETEKAHRKAVEQSKKEIGKFIQKDLYDEEKVAKAILSGMGSSNMMTNKVQNGGYLTDEDWKLAQQMQKTSRNYLDNEMEGDSILDAKSDSVVQSAGQLLGTSALAAMGIPADVVIGLTSYGGEMENALNQGASLEEAGLSAAVSAGAEILTEKISGGIKFGGKTLDEVGTKWLARNVSSKVGRTLAKMGMDVVGEGSEEVLSGIMSAVGQKMTYMEEKELKELFTKEDAWEAFIGGAALGFGGNAIQTANSAAKGVDAVTELTKNEQKVVDKVYKDELAKLKGKVTEKQKAKIYDEIVEDMEKGYISTDIIEEVLGGENYQRYKQASEWEQSLQKEFDDLGNKQNATLAEQHRYAELDKQLRNVKATSTLAQQKAQLNKDVYEMTKGDRLVESYFENVRSKQKYEADISKYEGKAKDVIQKVMDSGLADNSNQTHEFWDMAAKIASDRDTDISIATNDEILEMVKQEYEAEGKTFDASQFKGKIVDGYASKNGIVLNAQTKRALNFVVGHEITHTLEQSDQYKDLQKILFEYAKDEYKTRFDNRAGQYKDIYTEDGYKEKIDKEVAADMVGDILFTDRDFVKHLSTENRNVFQKMWDEVKHLYNLATAGSKEARQLEKVKKAFEDAYREAGKAEGKFSISDSTGKELSKGQQTMFEPPKPNPKVANVLTEESAIEKEKSGIGTKLAAALVDKGMVFENLSLKEGNHELQAKWNYALPSNTEARAQHFMENGAKGVKPLKDIKKAVDKSGKAEDFFTYLYHVHNIDRMTLEDRFDNVPNKTVFGETVTADVSRQKVAQYEKANPQFKEWANDVYAYNKHLRQLLVDSDVISQETADLWEKMYPHYVPIRRVDTQGQNISVPLDTRKTGVNNPVKRAIGGSSDIMPLFKTMAMRTEQTYRAIARNSFGIELLNTLGSEAIRQKPSVDEMIDTIGAQEDLLKQGTTNSNPTFTVFENGERVEFEITEDMFDALKPANKVLAHRFENSDKKAVRAVGKTLEARRNLLTTWNPVFALYRNPIKDIQDVAINSQHAVKTYMNIPHAIVQMAADSKLGKKLGLEGKYAQEYHQNGGKSNTYFDNRTNQFAKEDNFFKKIIGMPVRAIETAGEFIEEIPRLAEYIASRKEGRSVERSMLDAARVTTNFAAGGDFTKFLNSHGFTFLNASVQGASQHVRNFREAKQEGLKGYVKVLAKYTVAGLPTILLNSMVWDDDEDYEELSDYVKQNYYVVAKTEDGKFVRIPKGRTAAVMGELMNQMQNLVTGDDEADFSTFYELFMNNIAPSNPKENNIIAPIKQVLTNEAWYGGDLVPSRLQDLPAVEQFDESTDSISKWLGEKTNTSPYKWNYLLDQYSGGLGDTFLPMLTPEAESGDNSLKGNLIAPWKKELTTDMVLNNKNPGDFYDLKDELEKLSNSRNATEEDRMRTQYMDSVSWEMGDLYAQKREIQSSDMSDAVKYEKVRELQEQINELAKNAMEGYNNMSIDGLYSEVGDKRYNKDAESGKWYEIREKNSDGSDNYYYQKEQEVTQALGISYGEYWNNREEYNYAYDKPEQYALAQSVGGYQSYRGYTSELWDIKADKDENGKSISGSRKEKVIDWLNEQDIDYYHKIILFKNEYNADDTYNQEIIDYLNGREDISYEQMETILKYLGFEVDKNGYITWD